MTSNEKKNKNVPKEKFVTIFEGFFKAEDFSVKPAIFWDELFLLKVGKLFIAIFESIFIRESYSFKL
jgi:hypothetical protein